MKTLFKSISQYFKNRRNRKMRERLAFKINYSFARDDAYAFILENPRKRKLCERLAVRFNDRFDNRKEAFDFILNGPKPEDS